MPFAIIVSVLLIVLIVRLYLRRGRPRSEEVLDFTARSSAVGSHPELAAALKKSVTHAASVERAYLAVANVNGKDGVLMLGLRFISDLPDENVVRDCDAANRQMQGGPLVMAIVPLDEYSERRIAKFAQPFFVADARVHER